MKKLTIIGLVLSSSWCISAQILKPVKWSYAIKDSKTPETEIIITAKIDKGWHLYDMNLPEGGPISTSFTFDEIKGAKLKGKVTAQNASLKSFDPNFEMDLRRFENTAVFVQKIVITDKKTFSIKGTTEFMACNDSQCLQPTKDEFGFDAESIAGMNVEALSDVKKQSLPDSAVLSVDSAKTAVGTSIPVPLPSDSVWWKPVIAELQNYGEHDLADKAWYLIFFLGFAGGLLALLTPCVWPIIPMTVSFFLKRNDNRKKAVRQSFIYGISIIVIYLALGLIITAIFGASALNDLSTNAVFNLLFFALLIVFAVSFFGAFEITLPSSWTNKMNDKADSSMGLLSIFFMAFTLVLVSFSCTGPIIGTLLVQAASMGATLGPAIGMFGFALALAIPFTLFAIFPSWLKELPKSGGWLNSVKVVLGFLELALALKFLSVADLAYHWNILDREVFLSLWIAVFALLGFYLLGKIKFPHDGEVKHVSIPRVFLAWITFAFTIYLIPGLWGAPLKSISAFSPPLFTQDFNLYTGQVHAKFNDYETGMEYARKNGKPVIIDFSGYGCVNCRKMEAAVWTDSKVKDLLEKDYVLITLFVDDKALLPAPISVDDDGKNRTLKTVGDKWGYLQRHKFGANAQPFYVLLNNEGNPIAKSYSYDENIEKFVTYLQHGLKEYKN
ncbi:MAG: thioredoxin family protein [Candidatus Azobacteroides sp.]|nr:thioredoxin family protein [Candidatus Azobacteroides sp.]